MINNPFYQSNSFFSLKDILDYSHTSIQVKRTNIQQRTEFRLFLLNSYKKFIRKMNKIGTCWTRYVL